MTDGNENPAPRKKRSRRRRKKRDAGEAGVEAASSPPSPPPQPVEPREEAPATGPSSGYSNRQATPDRGTAPAHEGRPPREEPRPYARGRAAPKPSGEQASTDGNGDGRPGRRGGTGGDGGGGGDGGSRKKRKVRTKQCVHCMTPCVSIHRVQVDHRRRWVFICDICWPTRCVDNPHYAYGGLWVAGRVMKPDSQVMQERRGRRP